MNVVTEQKHYGVTLDSKGMRRIELGPGPLGPRLRCLIPLTGGVDEHWRQCFRTVQLEDTGFFRFRLEMSSNTIAFAATDSPDERGLRNELRVLAYLIESVNTQASKAERSY